MSAVSLREQRCGHMRLAQKGLFVYRTRRPESRCSISPPNDCHNVLEEIQKINSLACISISRIGISVNALRRRIVVADFEGMSYIMMFHTISRILRMLVERLGPMQKVGSVGSDPDAGGRHGVVAQFG